MTVPDIELQKDYINKIFLSNLRSGRTPRYSFKTFGCQMNENDSEKIAGMLEAMGFVYEKDFGRSDLIFFNTCCVRKSAEEKIYGWIGALKELKTSAPGTILCVLGCMTEQEHAVRKIKQSYGHIDIILGTKDAAALPEKLYALMNGIPDDCIPSIKETELFDLPYVSRNRSHKAYVTIMRGCDNFCSYCIVPYVRGRERSRDPDDICREISGLAENGCIEVTLLGQNVNSYGNDKGMKNAFSGLLQRISGIDGIKRIKFMTSHPKDLSDDLIYTVRDLDNVCRYIHLPLQSGSTKILQDMNRDYSKEKYLSLIEKIRAEIDDAVITSDIMVGYPGETEEDFLDTVDVVEKASFDNSFMFLYSKRPGTEASKKTNTVERHTAKERFDRLLKIQNGISYRMNEKMLGKKYKVLVEGVSKNNRSMLTGTTEGNKLVHFKGSESLTGSMVDVRIDSIRSFALGGRRENE